MTPVDDIVAEDSGGVDPELEKERKRSEELMSRLKYAQADLENLRKRTDREVSEARDGAVMEVARKLIVVADELDLAVRQLDGEGANPQLKEGILMVRKNMAAILESCGVSKIESVGRPFDPTLHEAVEKVEGDEDEAESVIEEVRPGYRYKGLVLRPSMVKVRLASERG
jgi:molecular chaperone GrpE